MKRFLSLTALVAFGMVGCGADAANEEVAAAAGAGSESASPPPFVCSDEQHIAPPGDGEAAVVVTNTRVGAHEDFDRVVFDLAPGAAPFDVIVAKNPSMTFIGEPNGEELRPGVPAVAGKTALDVLVLIADQPAPSAPRDLKPTDTKNIREIRSFGTFEGDLSYLIGLERESCYRVFHLQNPSRLVLDVTH
jgi:hypothetical protein